VIATNTIRIALAGLAPSVSGQREGIHPRSDRTKCGGKVVRVRGLSPRWECHAASRKSRSATSHNVELQPGRGGQIARSAGVQVI